MDADQIARISGMVAIVLIVGMVVVPVLRHLKLRVESWSDKDKK